MRASEIVTRPLHEQFWSQSQDQINQQAAKAAEKLSAKGYNQPIEIPTVQQAVAAVQKNPAQQQYIKGLVAQWQQSAPKATAPVTAQPKPTSSFAGRSAPLPTVTVSGKLLTKGPDGLWHGEDGRAVTDPAQVAKIDKAYYTGMTKQKGTVKEAPEEYTTSSGIVVPSGSKTDQPTADNNVYKTAFKKWATEKLQTVDPTTRRTITLDQIEKTDIKDELDRALDQVISTASDPTKNAVAVNNYLTIAVAGVTRVSQQLQSGSSDRPATGAGAVASTQAGQGIVTQQEIRNKLAQEVGLSTTQIEALKKLGQNPAARQALLKTFGVQT